MTHPSASAVAQIISDAGGAIVGRTRLQKCACALELAGFGSGFRFSYKHFGPFSEQLQVACSDAEALGLVTEMIKTATWGGSYSIFYAKADHEHEPADARRSARTDLLKLMCSADSIALELAVTAAFLASNSVQNPWNEVAERKYDKAGSIPAARRLYRDMLSVHTVKELPRID